MRLVDLVRFLAQNNIMLRIFPTDYSYCFQLSKANKRINRYFTVDTLMLFPDEAVYKILTESAMKLKEAVIADE